MAKRLSLIRNIVVIVGIIAGFVIWLFVPLTIKNSSILHVGNGEYGTKWGMLLALPLPLFSYFFHRKKLDFYGTDEERRTGKIRHASDTYGIDYCRGHGWDCNWFDVIAIHSMKLIFKTAGGYDHKKENR